MVFSNTSNSRYGSDFGQNRPIGRDRGNWLVAQTVELLTRLLKTVTEDMRIIYSLLRRTE